MNGSDVDPKVETDKRAQDARDDAAVKPVKPVSTDSIEVARLLREIVAEAERGEVVAVTVIKVRSPGQFNLSLTGNGLAEQFIGCSMMMDQLKGLMSGMLVIHNGQIMSAQVAAQMKQQAQRIVRPGAVPPEMLRNMKF
jgi:hypothetical protein